MLEPAGFERGYDDLAWHAITLDVAGNRVMIGSIGDLIRSKELLGREKDREHLPDLLARQPNSTWNEASTAIPATTSAWDSDINSPRPHHMTSHTDRSPRFRLERDGEDIGSIGVLGSG